MCAAQCNIIMPHFWRQYTQILLAKHILVQLSVTLPCLVHMVDGSLFKTVYTNTASKTHILLIFIIAVGGGGCSCCCCCVSVCVCVYYLHTKVYYSLLQHSFLASSLTFCITHVPAIQTVCAKGTIFDTQSMGRGLKKNIKKLHHQQQEEEAHKQTRTCV